MKFSGLPEKMGLYDPSFEHDACGIGAVTNIKGKRSHDIVTEALSILVNLEHRGGIGSEPNTGDGAGILFQVPDKFFRRISNVLNITLPDQGAYGVGMFFMPKDKAAREACEAIFEKEVASEGQTFLGWRDVPVNAEGLGDTALTCMPVIRQGFVAKAENVELGKVFERKLYVIRRNTEKAIENNAKLNGFSFYVPSFSSKTIVYKGMLLATQLRDFYLDLKDEDVVSSIALVHSRYSTNTFPSWERAHPNRYIIHNGEINTLRGNVNWMHTRQSLLKSDILGEELNKVLPVVDKEGSDSAILDNTLEFLMMNGRDLQHAVMMAIPEPWSKHTEMDKSKKDFYEYHSTLMEPWDGPAAVVFTDGDVMGATLDRNGLRPARYYVTKDDKLILSSEVGVLDIDPERILIKERLRPGRMLLVDTIKGELIDDNTLKMDYSSKQPYGKWLEENLLSLNKIKGEDHSEKEFSEIERVLLQKAFGYTYDDLTTTILPMAALGEEPIAAMGIDTPLAVLSDRPQSLFNYFKQLFAQVTNPPIDAIREEIVTATEAYLGSESNLLSPGPLNCKRIKLDNPILSNEDMSKIKTMKEDGYKVKVLPILFNSKEGGDSLKKALDNLFIEADKAFEEGFNILVLSDRGVNENLAPIPSLLAVSSLHHYLIREERRTSVSLIIESGEPRETHHFAALLGFGASAINPYLAYETINELVEKGMLDGTAAEGVYKFNKAAVKGIVKILSKMGISTVQSYQGAQIFEAIGVAKDVIDNYFTGTVTRIQGVSLEELAKEADIKHDSAFDKLAIDLSLDSEGSHKYRSNKEEHTYNPLTIHKLQESCKRGDYTTFKEYTNLLNQEKSIHSLRSVLDFVENPISIDEVESVESIVKRFKTGAMSYGSISKEAHETIAIAMNRLGGKSNTGEGGEDVARFTKDENGDDRCSAIKQVASGRFGVTSEYLVNAIELQIKMAQGAKPGEGGQLPATKVYPWVAKTRHSTPGVGLISPPPHHDIYSIEDLAQLIYDLKNSNTKARVSVKLVSEAGVGTIAAGVAKGGADVILISGYDGGTGASPRTSIKHTGLPWELGLAEAHQTLVMNNLRERVVVETDGKLMTGRDLAVAALLGAEEYGFATAPLVVIGCVMMRVCNLDTCPVGVATQNVELRKRFTGKPEHVVNFMEFIAQELREYMAKLGFRTINEMIGRTDKLKVRENIKGWKSKKVDLSALLNNDSMPKGESVYFKKGYDHKLETVIDSTTLLEMCAPALERGEKVTGEVSITNINRVFGTILGSEITRRYKGAGLPEDTIELKVNGSGGQSFGAFVPKGLKLELEGDCNDYMGKGLSGGKIIVYPSKKSTFKAEENIIIGNVAFYGATGGEAYIRGGAGERFCVRNSGVKTVVEAVGDHGCEYMTGGRVVVLGKTGRNFAAGMSGGVAYVLDTQGTFSKNCNTEMVSLEAVEIAEDVLELKTMIENHVKYTDSAIGKAVINEFESYKAKFVKVMPRDYKRMLEVIKKVEAEGYSGDEALMKAFEENTRSQVKK